MYKPIIINDIITDYVINYHGVIYNSATKRILKASSLDKDGYPIVSLSINAKHFTKHIHRLVAETFIPNPENKSEVHHKDGNKLNFDGDNLVWCTRKEHFELEKDVNGGIFIRAKGENHGNSKFTDKFIQSVIDELVKGTPQHIVSKKYDVSTDTIWKIYHKKSWTHLTKNVVFPEINNPPRTSYSEELKSSIIELLRAGYSPSCIMKKLNIEETPKMRNYIKTLKRRKLNI